MPDLYYNSAKFDELDSRLDANIAKIKQELDEFDRNFELVKKNWSGTEFEKAKPKLLLIKKTIQRALDDQIAQKKYLERKNQDFASRKSGF